MEYNFISTIDNSGRFVIPKRLLKELGWSNMPKVNVTVTEGKVLITKANDYKIFCSKCKRELRDDFIYCPYCGEKH